MLVSYLTWIAIHMQMRFRIIQKWSLLLLKFLFFLFLLHFIAVVVVVVAVRFVMAVAAMTIAIVLNTYLFFCMCTYFVVHVFRVCSCECYRFQWSSVWKKKSNEKTYNFFLFKVCAHSFTCLLYMYIYAIAYMLIDCICTLYMRC